MKNFVKLKYSKGSRAERELLKFLESNDYVVARIAGSGKNNNPDLLAFRQGMQFAFECKNWDNDYLHLKKEQVESLLHWQNVSGISTYIAWKHKDWYFLHPKELEETEKGYTISIKKAMMINRKLDWLV
ncbi:MAG: Holliday junction resolvase Hjc [Candidatus Micrarchaeota archaeon]|nr:Holliday junction resolvase Hjc [Candidatus Micrarchaeota archaeon]